MPAQRPHRLPLLLSALLLSTAIPFDASALGTDTAIVLRPHCLTGYAEDNRVLEENGDPEDIRCPSFSVEDPMTLRTPGLRVGDILDIDILVENPDKQELSRVRAWLSYDPNVLRGDEITLSEEFPVATPGEADFSETEGYAMIEGSVEGGGPDDVQVLVARVQFTVLKTTPAGTVMNFYDVQSGGHTTVTTGDAESETHVITKEPGALHVVFAEEEVPAPPVASASDASVSSATSVASVTSAADVSVASAASVATVAATSTSVSSVGPLLSDGEACITGSQCRSGGCIVGICQAAGSTLPDGAACGTNSQCASGSCVNNTCRAASSTTAELVPVGGVCVTDKECVSNLCASGICIPSLDTQRKEPPKPVPTSGEQKTAFALLQVQSLRVTTEGSAVYLGWEALNSSQIKGYNIYYGTTTGRYIQRKTVDATVKSLAIRSLPVGTTYYFAVRAVSVVDEESAFSQEVAVTVGDPKTSTAPLAPGSIPKDPGPGKNPVQASVTQKGGSVPGETGVPSVMATLMLLSAFIGTGFASRRQMIALTSTPER